MSSFVNTCCIKNCTPKSREKTNGNLSIKFYRFPSSTIGSAWKIDKRLKWINAVKNYIKYSNDWEPQNHSRICSLHFINNEKSDNPTHPSYIPSIFPDDENNKSIQGLQRFESEIQSGQITSMEKRQYGKWEEENMQQAIEAYRNKSCGFNECCRRFGIPKPTFRRHINGTIKRPLSFVKKNGKLPTLSENIEKELINRILNHESNFHGLSITDVRRLAFEIAEENQLPHKFNREIKLAGKKWFYDFLKRHPNLPIRIQSENALRVTHGSNKEELNHFLEKIEKYIRLNRIDVNRIYNMDESMFSTVQKKSGKIVCQRRKKRIEIGSRRLNTTIVYCANGAGSFIPPMFIFREHLDPNLRIEVPPGSLVEVAERGAITSELLMKWLRHFINYAKATPERKIILFARTKSLQALELAQQNGVILLQFPGLQSLDGGIFGAMQTYFSQTLDQWTTYNTGKSITQNDLAPLTTAAYFKAATESNALTAFKNSGCWPLNRFKPETLNTILDPSNSGKESTLSDENSRLKVTTTQIFSITKRNRGETIEEIVTVDQKIKEELIEECDSMEKKCIQNETFEAKYEGNNLTNSCLEVQHLTNAENIKVEGQLNTEFIIKDEIINENISESEQTVINSSLNLYKRTHTF
ncbi:uncharacterized protein LOC123296361 [Chrysoperla carnea]|uniref:uncharacterized protein LOC123296361 n=1 Tax=Chrysoperla carnea TaxID=189513 RepID=UPI001D08FFEB|nr:uncharacterized protein LOC123296361 [Chrysoperla carnea]